MADNAVAITVTVVLDALTARMLEHWASYEELDIPAAVAQILTNFVDEQVELCVYEEPKPPATPAPAVAPKPRSAPPRS